MREKLFYLKLIITCLILLASLQQISYSNQAVDQEALNFIMDSFMLTEEPQISIMSLTENISLIQFTFESSETILDIGNPITDHNMQGYLVIKNNFDKQKMEILEYGTGQTLPYSQEIIINEQLKNESLPGLRYFSPLESYWRLETTAEVIYLDGATGDWLPSLNGFQPIADNRLLYSHLIDYQLLNSHYNANLIFDPYEDLSWLIADMEEDGLSMEGLLDNLNNHQKVLYIGRKYANTVHFAYSVVGYQQFENSIYIALYNQDLQNTRYILLDQLLKYGEFHLLQ